VIFCGDRHFTAALPQTQLALERRGVSEVHLLQVPKDLVLQEASTAHMLLPFMETVDAALLADCPLLRTVIQFGVGLEGVDILAASSRGICVSNMPAHGSGNAEATAELAIWLATSLLRRAHDLQRRFRDQQLGGLPIPRQLRDRNITVIGFGSVGKLVCKAAAVFGARVHAVKKSPWPARGECADSDALAGRSSVEDLESIAKATDVLFLCCPITPETKELVNSNLVRSLPRGAIVVNVGRGPLVDHGAILDALKEERIAGYASDVGIGHPSKPSEPWDPEDELSKHPATLFTPHVGGYSDGSYIAMANLLVDAIVATREGKPPPVWVNQPKP